MRANKPHAIAATAADFRTGRPATVTRDEGAQNVLRNTYRLLSMTLAFSAVTAGVTAAMKLPHPGLLLTLGGYFGLLFLTTKLRNSAWGILSVFALTGFMGYTLGPMIAAYLSMPSGPNIVASALGTTAVVFVGLSWLATSGFAPDVRPLGNFLMIGILTAFCLGLAAYYFDMPALSLVVSGLFVLLMSGLILYQTQDIINGGERNYIMATVTLFVAIYNLFASLLQLLGFLGSDE